MLIFASYQDYKTKEISDIVHLLIICAGIINISIVTSTIGLFLIPLPFLIIVMIKEDSIGGADIKLMAACGFFLGVTAGLFASVIGLSLAILANAFKRKCKEGFALAPYLATGSFISYLIFF